MEGGGSETSAEVESVVEVDAGTGSRVGMVPDVPGSLDSAAVSVVISFLSEPFVAAPTVTAPMVKSVVAPSVTARRTAIEGEELLIENIHSSP